MSDYLDITDPDATKDMEVKPDPSIKWEDMRRKGEWVHCPVCKGYGGWHLKIDAYGEGRHFDCFCSQCHGYGWVLKGSTDETCVHKMGNRKTIGNCLNEYTCEHCGKREVIDSSD